MTWPLVVTYDEVYLYAKQILVDGVFTAAIPALLIDIAATHFEPASHAAAAAVMWSAQSMGSNMCMLVQGWLDARWKWFALLSSGTAISFAVLLLALVPERQGRLRHRRTLREVPASLLASYRLFGRALLSVPSITLCYIATFCTSTVLGMNGSYLQLWLVTEKGADTHSTTNLAGGLGIAALPLSLALGLLIDHLYERYLISRHFAAAVHQLIAAGLVFGMIAAAYDHEVAFWLCYYFGMCLAILPQAYSSMQLVERIPSKLRSSFIAVQMSVFGLGVSAAFKVEGQILDELEAQQDGHLYTHVFIGVACVMGAASPIYFALALLEKQDSVRLASLGSESLSK